MAYITKESGMAIISARHNKTNIYMYLNKSIAKLAFKQPSTYLKHHRLEALKIIVLKTQMDYWTHIMRKPAFAYAKTKTSNSVATVQLISTFVFFT